MTQKISVLPSKLFINKLNSEMNQINRPRIEPQHNHRLFSGEENRRTAIMNKMYVVNRNNPVILIELFFV